MAGQWVIEDEAPKGQWVIEDAPAPAMPKTITGLGAESLDRVKNYSGRDTNAGLVRGAGSIGATLLRPFESAEESAQRRTSMDQGLTSLIGSDPNSTQYKTAKLAAEVAGTSGIGGAAANLLGRIPGLATSAPAFLEALRTGGMSAQGAGMGTRVAGGALNGALTAGAINPADAGTGAVIGGAFPAVIKGAGMAGAALGGAGRKPINPVLQKTLQDSIEAGYVVPPNMVRPSLKNQIIESISGKQATQQIASTRNTEITEGLVRKSLGIADDVPLSTGTLESLRKTAGKAYADVSALSPQAAADLEALKVARNESQAWFKAYNRSARPDDLAQAKQFKATADSLETALEGHAKAAGKDSLVPTLREARKKIAKTYTVGRALNDASGTVDARVFGRMSEKGLPLSDGLDVAGKFASAFPTIAKSPQQVGSPAAHNLKSMGAMLMGGGGFAALGPAGVAAAAVPFIAPPIARSMMFRRGAQQGLLSQPSASAMGGLLSNSLDEALPLMYRTNPLLANYGQ